jgi:hypothetical protein
VVISARGQSIRFQITLAIERLNPVLSDVLQIFDDANLRKIQPELADTLDELG